MLLALGLVLLWLYRNHWRKQTLKQLGNEMVVQTLMPGYSVVLYSIKTVLLIAALAIGVIGLANLQSGSRTEKVERKGIDVMVPATTVQEPPLIDVDNKPVPPEAEAVTVVVPPGQVITPEVAVTETGDVNPKVIVAVAKQALSSST